MTRPDDERSERKALDALGMLAFLSHGRKEWSEEELEDFLAREAKEADLSEDEIAGTGEFAFEKVWSRIQAGEGCARRPWPNQSENVRCKGTCHIQASVRLECPVCRAGEQLTLLFQREGFIYRGELACSNCNADVTVVGTWGNDGKVTLEMEWEQ